jgi:hypothetical protein
VSHLRTIFNRIRETGITLKPTKCTIAAAQVSYLGFIVGGGLVKPDQLKIEAVKNFPRPITKKDIKSFLGTVGFYRRLIPSFAEIAAPLTDMTSGVLKKEVVWSEAAEKAFNQLKDCLITQPVLSAPEFTKPFCVQTDASARAISCVLLQEDDKSILHPCAFQSRKLNLAEQRYPIIEKEALAIVFACNVFKPYLVGNKFSLFTDHKPLLYIRQTKINNDRIYRWSLALEDMDFEISFLPGAKNFLADYLSRPPGALSC